MQVESQLSLSFRVFQDKVIDTLAVFIKAHSVVEMKAVDNFPGKSRSVTLCEKVDDLLFLDFDLVRLQLCFRVKFDDLFVYILKIGVFWIELFILSATSLLRLEGIHVLIVILFIRMHERLMPLCYTGDTLV